MVGQEHKKHLSDLCGLCVIKVGAHNNQCPYCKDPLLSEKSAEECRDFIIDANKLIQGAVVEEESGVITTITPSILFWCMSDQAPFINMPWFCTFLSRVQLIMRHACVFVVFLTNLVSPSSVLTLMWFCTVMSYMSDWFSLNALGLFRIHEKDGYAIVKIRPLNASTSTSAKCHYLVHTVVFLTTFIMAIRVSNEDDIYDFALAAICILLLAAVHFVNFVWFLLFR